ncbi:putative protein disulfide-isomerase ER-60 [Fasciola hepatica]|uniref:protein disulfide-isomerase n=1 Tax=Fasciola hepatica TaxID=6192 RepID=A0A2H1C347_FASHE|nr:putative protein disulfide-isomerase ER-60 [Fasciola hepatica]
MLVMLIFALLPLAYAEVVELTKDDFETKVSEKEYTLVMFYAPWCGHCKHLKPHFEEASSLLKESNVRLARLDCTAHGDKCTEFQVSGYPTVKLFKNGVFHKDYDGARDTDGIRAFMVKHSQPPSKKLDNVAQLKDLLASDDAGRLSVVVAYFKEQGSSLKTFQDVASSLLSDVLFAHTGDPSVLDSKRDSDIRLYRPRLLASKLEDQSLEYSGKVTSEALNDWIRKSQFGLVGYRSPQNDKFFPKDNLLVLYNNASLVDYVKGVNYYRNRLIKLLKTKPEWKLTFAYSYSLDYYHELSDLGEVDGPFPLVALYSSGKKYKHKLSDFKPDAIVKFVEDFTAGTLTAHIKSQPIPTPTDEAAVTAVGLTFDEVVNDESKDVLIMFHAPWCGHCKSLMPKFKEAAEKLRSEPGVRFVLYDATENEIPEPYEVRGYPTLYFVPRKSKNAPKSFEGSREVDDIIKYVAKESTEELQGFDRDGRLKKPEL